MLSRQLVTKTRWIDFTTLLRSVISNGSSGDNMFCKTSRLRGAVDNKEKSPKGGRELLYGLMSQDAVEDSAAIRVAFSMTIHTGMSVTSPFVPVCVFVSDVTLFVTDRDGAKCFGALFGDLKRGVRAASASAMLRSGGVKNCDSDTKVHCYQESDVAIK